MSHWEDFDREARRGIPRGIALLLVGVLVMALVGGAYLGIRYLTADVRGAADQRERTVAAGDYRIAAYDAFYDQCAAVQALEDQIATATANTTLPADQREQNIIALTNQRNSLIRQYNADARKTDTRGNFRASDLPYSLDTTQETTSCTP